MTGRAAVRRSRTARAAGEGLIASKKMAVRTWVQTRSKAAAVRRPRAGTTDSPVQATRSAGTTGSPAQATRSAREPATMRRPDAATRRDRAGAREGPLVLGRYRLVRRLGTGGFATVWLAHDERLGRDVAVKILPRERVIGGRFEREARAAARLAHPGIVTLYEAAIDDQGAYLVSEHVPGTTLENLLAEGRLSDRDVVQIGIALCDAVAYAHARGVIHRDVKPSNVLIPDHHTTPAQLARLTDFGVARVIGAETLTRTGDVIGTDAYMAPEQAQGLPAGTSADLFSLALVLYEALSGVNPLRHGLDGRRTRRVGVHLPPLRRQRRDLPRELGRALDLALRPRGGERGTIEELRGALVASVERVDDEPGVVADPWPTRTLRADDRSADCGEEWASDAAPTAPPRPARPREAGERTTRWPRRALAGAAAAALSLWVERRAPGALPIPPVLAGCATALVVAAVPRAGWLSLAALLAGALALHSAPETAAVIMAGALVPVALSPRDGPAWPLAVYQPHPADHDDDAEVLQQQRDPDRQVPDGVEETGLGSRDGEQPEERDHPEVAPQHPPPAAQ